MILGIIIMIAKHNDNNDDGKKQKITVPWGSFFFVAGGLPHFHLPNSLGTCKFAQETGKGIRCKVIFFDLRFLFRKTHQHTGLFLESWRFANLRK